MFSLLVIIHVLGGFEFKPTILTNKKKQSHSHQTTSKKRTTRPFLCCRIPAGINKNPSAVPVNFFDRHQMFLSKNWIIKILINKLMTVTPSLIGFSCTHGLLLLYTWVRDNPDHWGPTRSQIRSLTLLGCDYLPHCIWGRLASGRHSAAQRLLSFRVNARLPEIPFAAYQRGYEHMDMAKKWRKKLSTYENYEKGLGWLGNRLR